MGEGWGEGVYDIISTTYVPLPLIPSHQGRGNPTFYKCAKYRYNTLCTAPGTSNLADPDTINPISSIYQAIN